MTTFRFSGSASDRAEALTRYGVGALPDFYALSPLGVERAVYNEAHDFDVRFVHKKLKEGKLWSKWSRWSTALRKTIWLGANFEKRPQADRLCLIAHELHHIAWQAEVGVLGWVSAWLTDPESRMWAECGATLAWLQTAMALSSDPAVTANRLERKFLSGEAVAKFMDSYRLPGTGTLEVLYSTTLEAGLNRAYEERFLVLGKGGAGGKRPR